jgi:LPXTG-motif cell wall-anchored protein
VTVRFSTAAAASIVTLGIALGPCVAASAATQACDAYSHSCPAVQGEHFTKPTQVLGEQFTLPHTGADVALMSVIGVAAIGGGSGILIAARRRRSVSSKG